MKSHPAASCAAYTVYGLTRLFVFVSVCTLRLLVGSFASWALGEQFAPTSRDASSLNRGQRTELGLAELRELVGPGSQRPLGLSPDPPFSREDNRSFLL